MTDQAMAMNPETPLGPAASIAVEVRARLARSRGAIEQTFSEMGGSLTACAMSLAEISAAHEGIPGALNSAEFAEAEGALASISAELTRIAASGLDGGRQMERLREIAGRMDEPLAGIRKTMLLLEIISANVGILAAELSNQDDGLDAFASDMLVLAQGAVEEISAFTQLRAGLFSRLSAAETSGERFAIHHKDMLRRIIARLSSQGEAIARHRSAAGARLSQNALATRQMAGRIAEVVSSMQIGDITRQRLEHAELALEKLETEGTAAAWPLLQLVQAQLRDAVDDYRDRTTGIADGMPHLVEETVRVLNSGQEQARLLSSESGDALSGILDDMRQARALFQDFRRVSDEADGTTLVVAQAVEKMVARLGAIERIEHRVRILSFNMAAQCSRFGDEGRALLVVTGHLRELAQATAAGVDLVRACLGESAQVARAIAETNRRTADLKRIEESSQRAVAQIEQVLETIKTHAQSLKDRGPRALDTIREAAAEASRLLPVAAEWLDVLAVVQTALEDKPPPPPAQEELFKALRRSYTMDSERRIHDGLLAQWGLPAGQDDEEVMAAPNDDEDPLSALF